MDQRKSEGKSIISTLFLALIIKSLGLTTEPKSTFLVLVHSSRLFIWIMTLLLSSMRCLRYEDRLSFSYTTLKSDGFGEGYGMPGQGESGKLRMSASPSELIIKAAKKSKENSMEVVALCPG
ncbi:uncharacterized protein LOC141655908 [Silene latifolia]|uniref:uncharacterized protein LOC141655908 n=1 Tax=Silene latifolia TaxID=37657 RepID=UPI003D789520